MRKTALLASQTSAYKELWDSIFPDPWKSTSPVRRAEDRRRLLVELDVLVSMALELDRNELLTLFRTQFPVLRNYDATEFYDKNGRKVPKPVVDNYSVHGEELPEELRQWTHPQSGVRYIFELPFRILDREQDYIRAWAQFENELR